MADDCYNFTCRLTANRIPMIVSHLVIEELEHCMIKGVYTKYAKQNATRWDILQKRTNKYMDEAHLEIERVLTELELHPNIIDLEVTVDAEFAKLRREASKSYSLNARDAAIVVVTSQIPGSAIATVDYDYHNVTGLNVFSPNNKYFIPQSTQIPHSTLYQGKNIDVKIYSTPISVLAHFDTTGKPRTYRLSLDGRELKIDQVLSVTEEKLAGIECSFFAVKARSKASSGRLKSSMN